MQRSDIASHSFRIKFNKYTSEFNANMTHIRKRKIVSRIIRVLHMRTQLMKRWQKLDRTRIQYKFHIESSHKQRKQAV